MDSVPTIIARYIDAYNRMNVQAMLDCLSGDVRFINRSNGETTNETHGIEAFRALAEQGVQLFAEREQTILTEGDTEELPALAAHKEQLAETLNELARQRNEFLYSAGFQPGRAGMDAWLSANKAHHGAVASWNQTISLAERAKNLNLRNGQLIQLRMKYNAQALEILLRRENNLDLYGPDGRSSAQGDRRIDDAV